MTLFRKTEKGTLKQTFIDISLLYRNFFHWNISKIIFLLYGLLLGFISILPLALIYYIYTKIFGGTFSIYITSILNSVFLGDTFGNIIHILSLVFFAISSYFSYILLIKLNNSYIKGEKIPFFKNSYLNKLYDYLNKKHGKLLTLLIFLTFFILVILIDVVTYLLNIPLWKYIGKYLLLTLLFFLILLIPIILVISLLSLIINFLGGVEAVISLTLTGPINFFSIFSFCSFLILVFVLFYVFYRFIFSYFILVDTSEDKKVGVFASLKESLKQTKGFKKFWNFVKIFFIIGILYFPFYSIDKHLSETYTDLNYYVKYINLGEQDKESLKSLNSYYYENLELAYSGKELEEINILQNRYYLFVTFFGIFKFLFINGILLMTLNSIYNRIIKE